MLSYRHAFHAGNHADILKHLVLVNSLHYATRKDAPLFYLDTHSGAGLYQLESEQALKTGEARAGILKLDREALLRDADEQARAALQLYFAALDPFLEKRCYPGSPLLSAALLRRQDHLHLCELHPADFQLLRARTEKDRRIRCEQQDGYRAALNLIPPAQKRALVLIDPSYEEDADFQGMARLIGEIHQRMASAMILLWYPVVRRADCDRLIAGLQRREIRDLWQSELGIAPDSQGYGMTASGMLLVNPPWTLPEQLRHCLPLLQQQLAPQQGYWKVERLTAE